MGKPGPKTGRKAKEFDWNFVISLAMRGAPCIFIAERMLAGKNITPETYGERYKQALEAMRKRIVRNIKIVYGTDYVQFSQQKMEAKRMKLHELQWKAAEAGNVSMLIWLGKQLLGQSEKTESILKQDDTKLVIQFTEEGKNAVKEGL